MLHSGIQKVGMEFMAFLRWKFSSVHVPCAHI
jgi:hypothetical protein